MNRSDLVQLLSERSRQLTQGDAEAAVSTILEAAYKVLAGLSAARATPNADRVCGLWGPAKF